MEYRENLKSNVWKFYAITALGIRFIQPIRILYLLSFGLSYTNIGVMELSAAIAIIFLELPTGIFADFYGRKKSRMLAYLFSIIAFTFMSFGSTLPVFIIGWTLSGIADAFQSGAQDALIFDTYKSLEREKDYIKLKSHFVLINAVSVIIGSIIGSYLYTIDKRLPWYLITMTIIVSAIVFSTVKEPRYLTKYLSIKNQLSEFKKSFIFSISNFQVRRLIVFGMVLMIPMYVFTTLINQPYLISIGFNVESLGIIFAVITGVGGWAGSFSHKIEKYLKMRLSLLSVIVLLTVILGIMGLYNSPWLLFLVIGFYVIDNFKNVIMDNYLNEAIPSESRATVLSTQSFINNIFITVLFVFIGHLIDVFSINFVLVCLAGAVFVLGLPLWLMDNHKLMFKQVK